MPQPAATSPSIFSVSSADIDSVVLLREDQVFTHSDAALEVIAS